MACVTHYERGRGWAVTAHPQTKEEIWLEKINARNEKLEKISALSTWPAAAGAIEAIMWPKV